MRRRFSKPKGFSLIEVVFAIMILGIGIVGILSLFVTGVNAANWSGNQTFAAMEAQSLLTRVLSEVTTGPGVKRKYLDRIKQMDPALQTPPGVHSYVGTGQFINDNLSAVPNQIDDPTLPGAVNYKSDLFWSCRVSNSPMDLNDPLNAPDPNPTVLYPVGLFQISIAVYRRYTTGKAPIAVYTTFVTAGF